ncbi:MAG: N4-gp56 family major capsid protein [Pseudomonadota bacterium]
MATTTSTSTGISQRTNVYAERKMLKYAMPHLVLERFGMPQIMPQNKSATIKWRRPVTFDAATTALAEGVTPTSTVFSYEDVEATLRQYGMVVEITDVIEDTHEDPVLRNVTKQVGDNIGRTLEQLNYAVVRAGTNVLYANGTARNQVNTPLTQTLLRKAVRILKRQKAKKLTEVLGSSPDYGVLPIEPAYVAVIHVDLESDVRNLPGFLDCSKYATKNKVHEHEFGSVEEVRFVCSADLLPFADAGATANGMVSTTGTNADVYPMMIFGEESWAHVALRGMDSVSPSIIPVNQKTKDDPLGQRGYCGFKTYHAAAILNDLWMIRTEVGATDL